jgi:hypothetical protein
MNMCCGSGWLGLTNKQRLPLGDVKEMMDRLCCSADRDGEAREGVGEVICAPGKHSDTETHVSAG